MIYCPAWPSIIIFYDRSYLQALTLSIRPLWFCQRDNTVLRRQAETSQTCYIHWGVDLWQPRVHKFNCSQQLPHFKTQGRAHLAPLGHTLALICKDVNVPCRLVREEEEGASLCSLTFVGYWPAHVRHLRGAINGRKCPWCGYKRTPAPRWDDDHDLRLGRVTQNWGGITWLVQLNLIKRMRWREEWPECMTNASGHICRQTVTAGLNRRQIQVFCMYLSPCVTPLHHLKVPTCLQRLQQIFTLKTTYALNMYTCCDSPMHLSATRPPYVIKVLEIGAVRS